MHITDGDFNNFLFQVIKAVSHCRYILNPEFIKDLCVAIREKTKIPLQSKYLPPADESLKNAKFNPIPERKTLFNSLQFVFMTEQDKQQSRELVDDLDGTVALLDPLCQDRRSIILSEDSIVMETKDVALSDYLRTTLVERGLVPTKHNDLILALLYNDKSKLFKKVTDSISSQSVHIKVQDTQCSSQMTCSVQNNQILENKTCDVSTIEASVEPPRLDKTVFDTSKEVPSSTIKDKIDSCASTIKQEMNSEVCGPSDSDDKKPGIPITASVSKPKNEISFYEASAVPPNLDKTIKTPLASPLNPKSEVTFVEPSVVPPRLDATIKSPVTYRESTASTASSSGKDTSLDTQSTSHTITGSKNGGLFSTPSRTSTGSDISLFDSSRSASLFGGTTPSRVNSPKLAFMSSTKAAASNTKRSRVWDDEDSDDDEDINPFAVSKTKSSFLGNSLSGNNKTYYNSKNTPSENASKKTKMNHFGEDSGNCPELTDVVKCAPNVEISENSSDRVCESPPEQLSGTSEQTPNNPPVEVPSSSSQSFKRELHDKSESATKKFKADGSPSFSVTTCEGSIITIPDTSSNVWIKRPDTKQELEKTVASLVITDVSADLIKGTNESCAQTAVSNVDNKNVVNFKRFKKKGVIVRSMSVTLTDGQFRGNSTSIFDASQQVSHFGN